MRRLARALAVALAALGGAGDAPAQAPAATLIADAVTIDAAQRLVAEGNVAVLYAGNRLTAARIVYDRATDSLALTGPVTLTDPAGNILRGGEAIVSADLREGLLRSARLVLDRQLQIAANEVARVEGRYTRLSRAVASSCRVCASGEAPLWEIRARRVVHDAQERQLYFDEAQLRVAGLPVFWLPRLRMPDPTLTRATGFLMPRLFSTSAAGTGIQIPYFFVLGPSRDLTLIPQVSTGGGAGGGSATLGFRWRQAFRNGTVEIAGTGTTDALAPGLRGHVFARGAFALPQGARLRFALEGVSDRTYLTDYGIADRDRLVSAVEIDRIRRDRLGAMRVTLFSSLRAGDDNATIPALAADAILRRRHDPGALIGPAGRLLGGRIDARIEAHGHARASGADAVGRDVLRLGLAADWRRDWRLGPGVVVEAALGVTGDIYTIAQDAAYPDPVGQFQPAAALTLRWPLVRVEAGGRARAVIEPLAQLAWSQTLAPAAVPNEDSLLVEFDEGNLFAPSRYPGADRREGGARLNLGLAWRRDAASGWVTGATVGRVIRLDGAQPFTVPSGLAGPASDWLVAGFIAAPQGLRLQGRALVDDAFGVRRGDLRLVVDRPGYGLATAYAWAAADAAEGRPAALSEAVLDGRLRLARGWIARASGRYDFTADRPRAAALGLEFQNECLRLNLSLTRSFTAATSVGESTNIALAVDFLGFGGAPAEGGATRQCRR
jgi:LPS-assembly protein